jgi:hypothetical protein
MHDFMLLDVTSVIVIAVVVSTISTNNIKCVIFIRKKFVKSRPQLRIKR